MCFALDGVICLPQTHAHMLIDGWEIIKCPDCGDECYLTQAARETIERHPKITAACTRCAMKKSYEWNGDIVKGG